MLHRPILSALILSLATTIALGLTRFSYGFLLSPMRDDMAWSYLLAGAINTSNALGYLIGALMTPRLTRRFGVTTMLLAGAICASVLTMACGMVSDARAMLILRGCAGLVSAWIFIAGGLLAARLAALHAARAGLLIGIFYAGTGLGITLSALLVPIAMHAATGAQYAHPWQAAWILLGLLCAISTLILCLTIGKIAGLPDIGDVTAAAAASFRWSHFKPALAGYFMFGMGYIGYMTFVIALLHEQGMTAAQITAFYALLGCAVMLSSRLWARLLDRFKGGQSLAIFNTLLALAALLPVLTNAGIAIFISGIVFGATFLSAVASTTALVRHNLPPASWSAGIGAFTIMFALGQVIGPSATGWIADGSGGLRQGMLFSALSLAVGAILAARQKPLAAP